MSDQHKDRENPDGKDQEDNGKWYDGGVRFQCVNCGKCCCDHGEYTYVYVTGDDILAISLYLKMPVGEFYAGYCEQSCGLVYIKMTGPDCPFFADGGCVIYPVRPLQCKTWPFWLENLDKETWDKEVRPFCPGVGKGKRYSGEEIERIARESEEGFIEPC